MDHEHVSVIVEDAEPPGPERVPAQRLAAQRWRLLKSPLYAQGVAAGDVIEVIDEKRGTYRVVSRGGNVGIQLYAPESEIDDLDATQQLEAIATRRLRPLGGRADGMTAGLIVFSIPVRVGFSRIEGALAAIVGCRPGAQWEYTNVYDSMEQPLRWWEQAPPGTPKTPLDD